MYYGNVLLSRLMIMLIGCGLDASATCAAQVDQWLEDGIRWEETTACAQPGLQGCGVATTHLFTVLGDTVVAGHPYKKVFHRSIRVLYESGAPPGSCADDTVFYADASVPSFFARDSLGSMFTYQYDRDTLMYKMDLALGDTVPRTAWWYYPDEVVTAIDSIEIHGSYRKRFHASYHTLIAGIGWTDHVNAGFFTPDYAGYCGYGPFCYSIGDTAYYPSPGPACTLPIATAQPSPASGDITLFPDPAGDAITLDLPDGSERYRIISAVGQVVRQADRPPAGTTTIPLDRLSSGSYYMELTTGTSRIVRRFLIVR